MPLVTKLIIAGTVKSGIARDVVEGVDDVADDIINHARDYIGTNAPELLEKGLEVGLDVVEIGKDVVTGVAEGAVDVAEEVSEFLDDTFGGISEFFGF